MTEHHAQRGLETNVALREHGTPDGAALASPLGWGTRITSDGPVGAVLFTDSAASGGWDGSARLWMEYLESRTLFDLDNPRLCQEKMDGWQRSASDPEEERPENIAGAQLSGPAASGEPTTRLAAEGSPPGLGPRSDGIAEELPGR